MPDLLNWLPTYEVGGFGLVVAGLSALAALPLMLPVVGMADSDNDELANPITAQFNITRHTYPMPENVFGEDAFLVLAPLEFISTGGSENLDRMLGSQTHGGVYYVAGTIEGLAMIVNIATAEEASIAKPERQAMKRNEMRRVLLNALLKDLNMELEGTLLPQTRVIAECLYLQNVDQEREEAVEAMIAAKLNSSINVFRLVPPCVPEIDVSRISSTPEMILQIEFSLLKDDSAQQTGSSPALVLPLLGFFTGASAFSEAVSGLALADPGSVMAGLGALAMLPLVGAVVPGGTSLPETYLVDVQTRKPIPTEIEYGEPVPGCTEKIILKVGDSEVGDIDLEINFHRVEISSIGTEPQHQYAQKLGERQYQYVGYRLMQQAARCADELDDYGGYCMRVRCSRQNTSGLSFYKSMEKFGLQETGGFFYIEFELEKNDIGGFLSGIDDYIAERTAVGVVPEGTSPGARAADFTPPGCKTGGVVSGGESLGAQELRDNFLRQVDRRRFDWKDPRERDKHCLERTAYVSSMPANTYYQWRAPPGNELIALDTHLIIYPTDFEIENFPDLRTLSMSIGENCPEGAFGRLDGIFGEDENNDPIFLFGIIQPGDYWRELKKETTARYDPLRGASRRAGGNRYSWFGAAINTSEIDLEAIGVRRVAVLSNQGVKAIRSLSGVSIYDNTADKMYSKPGPGYEHQELTININGIPFCLQCWVKELKRAETIILGNNADHTPRGCKTAGVAPDETSPEAHPITADAMRQAAEYYRQVGLPEIAEGFDRLADELERHQQQLAATADERGPPQIIDFHEIGPVDARTLVAWRDEAGNINWNIPEEDLPESLGNQIRIHERQPNEDAAIAAQAREFARSTGLTLDENLLSAVAGWELAIPLFPEVLETELSKLRRGIMTLLPKVKKLAVRQMLVIPGSGYWMGRLFEIIWSAVYPDDPLQIVYIQHDAERRLTAESKRGIEDILSGDGEVILFDDMVSTGSQFIAAIQGKSKLKKHQSISSLAGAGTLDKICKVWGVDWAENFDIWERFDRPGNPLALRFIPAAPMVASGSYVQMFNLWAKRGYCRDLLFGILYSRADTYWRWIRKWPQFVGFSVLGAKDIRKVFPARVIDDFRQNSLQYLDQRLPYDLVIIAARILLAHFKFVSGKAPGRILCVGDSITRGVVGSSRAQGYRGKLAELLQNAGYACEFVGPFHDPYLEDNPEANAHLAWDDIYTHQAHKDQQASACSLLNDYLNSSLPHPNPLHSAVLLHIGTNDISDSEVDLTRSVACVERTIDMLNKFDPYHTLAIYVALIIPRGDDPQKAIWENHRIAQRHNEYSYRLKEMLEVKRRVNPCIYTVDMEEAFRKEPFTWQRKYLADPWHPNDQGYDLMAQTWFEAIQKNVSQLEADHTPRGCKTAGVVPDGESPEAGGMFSVTRNKRISLEDYLAEHPEAEPLYFDDQTLYFSPVAVFSRADDLADGVIEYLSWGNFLLTEEGNFGEMFYYEGPAISSHGDERAESFMAAGVSMECILRVVYSLEDKSLLILGCNFSGAPICTTVPCVYGSDEILRSRVRGGLHGFDLGTSRRIVRSFEFHGELYECWVEANGFWRMSKPRDKTGQPLLMPILLYENNGKCPVLQEQLSGKSLFNIEGVAAGGTSPGELSVEERIQAALVVIGRDTERHWRSPNWLNNSIARRIESNHPSLGRYRNIDEYAKDLGDLESLAFHDLLSTIGNENDTKLFRNPFQLNWLTQLIQRRIKDSPGIGDTVKNSNRLKLGLLSLGVSRGDELASALTVTFDSAEAGEGWRTWKDRFAVRAVGVDIDSRAINTAKGKLCSDGYRWGDIRRTRHLSRREKEERLREVNQCLERIELGRLHCNIDLLVLSLLDPTVDVYIQQADFIFLNNVLYYLHIDVQKQLLIKLLQMKPGAVLLTSDIKEWLYEIIAPYFIEVDKQVGGPSLILERKASEEDNNKQSGEE